MRSLLPGRVSEQVSRSIVKTIGYRTLMVLITVVVAFLVTDDVSAALNIGIITNVIKTGTYFGYERLWARIGWGLSGSTP